MMAYKSGHTRLMEKFGGGQKIPLKTLLEFPINKAVRIGIGVTTCLVHRDERAAAFVVTYERNGRLGRHQHDAVERLVVISGSVRWVEEGRDLVAGEEVVIPPGVDHTIDDWNKTGATLYIEFEKS